MRTPVKAITVLLLVLSLGLHWALLQTVAWTGMLITYTRDGSFQEAVAKTFDGRHPCALCKAVKAGRAEEEKREEQRIKPGVKLDLGLVWEATDFDFCCPGDRFPSLDSFGSSRAEQPPRPRPRLFVGSHVCA